MIDTHCHADLYPDPSLVIEKARRSGVGVVAVTNLPSAYDRAHPFVGNARGVRLALGLHPLLATEHASERERFAQLAARVRYIGEAGLDFSPQGFKTRDEQVASFRFVLGCIRDIPRFVTVHSRRAEVEVLRLLGEEGCEYPIIFHWYSGSLKTLDAALAAGHYFSVNPAMIAGANGRKVVASLPKERVLTETDGPFVTVAERPAVPADVSRVAEGLALVWDVDPEDCRQQLDQNFKTFRTALGGLGETITPLI